MRRPFSQAVLDAGLEDLFPEETRCGPMQAPPRLCTDGSVELLLGTGKLTVSFLEGSLLRVTMSTQPHTSVPSASWGIVHRPAVIEPDVRASGGSQHLSAGSMSLSVTEASGAFAVGVEGIGAILEAPSCSFRTYGERIGAVFFLDAHRHCFGLGEKTGELSKRGRRWCMWNSDEPRHTFGRDPLYVSIPLMLLKDKRGWVSLMLDEPGKSWFDAGREHEQSLAVTSSSGTLDLYLWHSPTAAEAVRMYTELTGRIEMPPLWALGYHQSRYSYKDQEEVLAVADEMRRREIPCDALYLDIHYMHGYRVFTWDPDRFPDPHQMTAVLASRGFKAVPIVDPGVKEDHSYSIFRQGMESGWFCTSEDGTPYVGAAWPGYAVYPDFSSRKVRSWWAGCHSALFDAGVSGIWNDMNEPSDFTGDPHDRMKFTVPPGVTMRPEGEPIAFERLHNIYGQAMCLAAKEAFRMYRPETRPFILTRAGYLGIQRLAAVWTGDNSSWWDHMALSIPMLLNLGLSGVPFVGADAGGFQDNASPELFARWFQYASMTPFFRCHSADGTARHEPWSFGPETEEACRKAAAQRYRLLPYLYQCFRDACLTGAPVMRPLFWEFEEDDRSYLVQDQFLLGSSLLAAPVIQPGAGARAVYLPPGEWECRETGARYRGSQYILADSPLDVMPVFARCPSIIPETRPKFHTDRACWDPLILHAYVSEGEEREISCEVYEDDGHSYAYTRGSYCLTRWTWTPDGGGTLRSKHIAGDKDISRGDVEVVVHKGKSCWG